MNIHHPNFACSAMVSTTDQLLADLSEMDVVVDHLQASRTDPVWGDNVLAAMLYRDCLIRELERRGVNTGYSPLLQSPTTGEIIAPGYQPPEWLSAISMTEETHR